jgi:curli production assembly/transport component CsgG/holdfast attachment protein HfaB
MSAALTCMRQQLARDQDIRIGVADMVDGTGASLGESDNAGRMVTQRPDLMLLVALNRAGARLVNRTSIGVAEWELREAMARRLGDGRETRVGDATIPFRPVRVGEIVGSTYYISGAVTEYNYNIHSDVQELGILGATAGRRSYRVSVAVDLVVTRSTTTEVRIARSYGKQLVGQEIGAGVFRFLEAGVGNTRTELFEANIGQRQNEPVQAALRWVIETAAYDILAELYGRNPTCDRAVPGFDPAGLNHEASGNVPPAQPEPPARPEPQQPARPSPPPGIMQFEGATAPAAAPQGQSAAADPSPEQSAATVVETAAATPAPSTAQGEVRVAPVAAVQAPAPAPIVAVQAAAPMPVAAVQAPRPMPVAAVQPAPAAPVAAVQAAPAVAAEAPAPAASPFRAFFASFRGQDPAQSAGAPNHAIGGGGGVFDADEADAEPIPALAQSSSAAAPRAMLRGGISEGLPALLVDLSGGAAYEVVSNTARGLLLRFTTRPEFLPGDMPAGLTVQAQQGDQLLIRAPEGVRIRAGATAPQLIIEPLSQRPRQRARSGNAAALPAWGGHTA